MNGQGVKKNYFIRMILMTLMLALPTGGWGATAGTVYIRVSDVADDAQQSEGIVTTEIDDLVLGQGEAVGIRFQGLTIPQGSAITRAYIQFTADVVSADATDLVVYTETNDDAPAFAAMPHNIMARTRSTASVPWVSVPVWGSASETGVIHQSADLSEIVEEVVKRAGWVSGNAIVFIIEGTGSRIARAFQGDPDKAPLLHVEYAAGAIDVPISDPDDDAQEDGVGSMQTGTLHLDLDDNHLVGLRFQDVNLPPGAEIIKAYIRLAADAVQFDDTSVSIYVQDHDDAPAFTLGDHNISARTLSEEYSRWTGVEPWMKRHQFYQTPDLSSLVQEVVGRSGWAANNDMVFVLETSHGQRQVTTYNAGDPDLAAVLHIEYARDNLPIISINKANLSATCHQGDDAPSDTFSIKNTGVGTLNYAMSVDVPWMTLSATSGSLTPGASDTIIVTYDTDAKSIGTYSGRITISASGTIASPGAANSPSELVTSLTVLKEDPNHSCSSIPVYARDLASPALMILLDTTGSMKWLAPVTSQHEYKLSADLSPIVQEIVDRSDWRSGNSLAFIMEGSGQRAAWDWFQTDAHQSTWLNIVYEDDSGQHEFWKRIWGYNDATEVISTGQVKTRRFVYLGTDVDNEPVLTALRYANVTVPQNANITLAKLWFYVAEIDTDPTHITVWCEDIADAPAIDKRTVGNISSRIRTSASVLWNVEPWDAITWRQKLPIAQDVIKELIQDRGIAWGIGSWNSRKPADEDYTVIHESCAPATDAHIAALEAAVDAMGHTGTTPYAHSVVGGRKYFQGLKADEDGEIYTPMECQPKFLIDIADGAGRTTDPYFSTPENVGIAVAEAADAGITPVAVGFNMVYHDLSQIYKFAEVANAKGHIDPDDDVYALHEEVGGVAQPFFANSQVELLEALRLITDGVKGAIYHGSAPAPSSSTNLGDSIIVAKYDATNWTGDVIRLQKNPSGEWVTQAWSASEQMPSNRHLWTIDPATDGTVIEYTDATLAGDSFDCLDPGNLNNVTAKPIGDIINSRPLVVDHPPFAYQFDGYGTFGLNMTRDPMIYVGANDGALHAIQLSDGVERWAFFPKSSHSKLMATDRCSDGYCHQYFVDGSPIAADVYAAFGAVDKDWRTILVVGQQEGGETYFALDVTHGKQFDDANNPSQFLWEFSDDELGQTWGQAAIERVALAGQEQNNSDPHNDSASEWAVFFSSGYPSDPGDMGTKEAYVYGIVADDGSDLWIESDGYTTTHRIKLVEGPTQIVYGSISGGAFEVGEVLTQTGPDASGTITAIDVAGSSLTVENITGTFQAGKAIEGITSGAAAVATSVNSSGGLTRNALSPVTAVDLILANRAVDPLLSYYTDYLYVGDLYGNMYRISQIGKGMHPEVSTLFTFNHSPGEVYDNPIRSKAAFAYDYTMEDIWVYYGTGIYEQQLHKGDNNQQYFFGLKDGVVPAPTYEMDDLVKLEAKFDTETIGGKTMTVRYVVGDNSDAESWTMKLFAKQTDWGWPGDAPVGSERVLAQPLAVGEIVFFTTFIPDDDVCAGNGETWLFALNFNTGMPADEAVFDINHDGAFDENDKVDIDDDGDKDIFPVGIRIGRGQGSEPVLHKDTLIVATTGEEDPFHAEKVNIPQARVRVRSWWQN